VEKLELHELSLTDLYRLGCHLEDGGSADAARDVYQEIRSRDISFRDVARRLENLQRQETPVPADLHRVLADRFRDVQLVGRGGMGVVYRARDRRLKRDVAIKVPDRSIVQDPSIRKRFVREVETLARLDHPSVTRIFDVQVDGPLYFTMEFVEGSSLDEMLKQRPRLDPEEVLNILVPVAGALEAVHAEGIIHRDLKPGNILIDQDGRSRLTDFGLAFIGGDTAITQTGSVVGTPAYVPPELLLGKPPSPTADVYSFGMMMYRALTGQLAFPPEPLLARTQREAPRLRELRPEVDPRLDELVARCLARDPAQRPADGGELRASLEALQGDRAAAEEAWRAGLTALEALVGGELHALKNRAHRVPEGELPAQLGDELVAARGLLGALPLPDELRDDLGDVLSLLRDAFEAPTRQGLDDAHVAALRFLRDHELNFPEVLDEVANAHRLAGAVTLERGLPPPPVRCRDATAARRDMVAILDNLVGNAFEAGASAVKVHLETAEPDAEAARILVRDDGPGIPPGIREKLLREPTTTRGDGRGTGLLRAARLCQQRGWEIALDPGDPTTFRLEIPA
jgi:signal transduction histidine kinase/predicted Ser/Thr protein kinase